MRATRRGQCAPFWVAIIVVAAAGCDGVREDRTITFSPQGDTVGLQHGQEGVFIADKDGGGLTKIFQPGADVLATSTPLWAPTGKRLIFTTARDPSAVDPQGAQASIGGLHAGLGNEQDPAGRIHLRRPVVYTCWLRDEEASAKEPVALFEASCDHVGYVAANLAVRWHPQGDRIVYVREVGQGQHGVFEYDLRTKASRRIFPHTAAALIFDWAPGGEHLACVLGTTGGHGDHDGVWIGRPGDDWWHVPESAALAEGELPSVLERLRATRPTWTADGRRFAFVSFTPAADKQKPGQPGRHSLRLGLVSEQTTQELTESREPLGDLHWSPDGSRLGLIRGRENASLHFIEPGGELSAPIGRRSPRSFAGWSCQAKHVACTVPDKIPYGALDRWAFLLVPDAEARDAIFMADGNGGAEREVFSGMRATFCQWSPTEEKLSVWFTFSPTYRSWLGRLLGAGLHRGDPAAIFDPGTGEIAWMAVNADEKFQVGHYYLLKRDYARAWKWYEEAAAEAPQPAAPEAANLLQFLTQAAAPRDTKFFQYYCLSKLGRHDQAQAKLREFEESFLPHLAAVQQDNWIAAVAGSPEAAKELLGELTDPQGLTLAMLRDLYMAEVFLSLDAAEDGERFFQARLAAGRSDAQRFSDAVVLSQLLLLQKKHAAYVDLATGTIVPLAAKLPHPTADVAERLGRQWRGDELRAFVVLSSAWPALLPLAAPEFLEKLPDESARRLWKCWQEVDPVAGNDFTKQSLDLAKLATAARLGLEKDQPELVARVAARHPNWQETVAASVRDLRGLGGWLLRRP